MCSHRLDAGALQNHFVLHSDNLVDRRVAWDFTSRHRLVDFVATHCRIVVEGDRSYDDRRHADAQAGSLRGVSFQARVLPQD